MAKMTKDELVNAIAELTVLELSELVKAIEEKFGVKAAAPAVAVAAAAAPAAGGAAEEKDEFNVMLTAVDAAKKIAVIKDMVMPNRVKTPIFPICFLGDFLPFLFCVSSTIDNVAILGIFSPFICYNQSLQRKEFDFL